MVISYHKQDLKGKEQEPSVFVAEIRESGIAEEKEILIETEELSSFIAGLNEQKEVSLPKSLLDSPYIDNLIEKYTLKYVGSYNFVKYAQTGQNATFVLIHTKICFEHYVHKRA